MSRVVYTDESGQEHSVPVGPDQPVVSIGRAKECTIRSSKKSVSRNHAEIRWEDGTCKVVDLDSSNGTYVIVNGERQPVLSPEPLGHNDEVWCGDFILYFYEDDREQAVDMGDGEPLQGPARTGGGRGPSTGEPGPTHQGGPNPAEAVDGGAASAEASVEEFEEIEPEVIGDVEEVDDQSFEELERLREEKQSIEELASRQADELDELQERLNEAQRKLDEQRSVDREELDRLRTKVEDFEDDNEYLREENHRLKEERDRARDRVGELDDEVQELRSELDEAREEISALEEDLERAYERNDELREEVESAENLEEELEERDRTIESLEREVEQLERQLERAEADAERADEANEEIDELRDQLEERRQVVDDLEERNSELLDRLQEREEEADRLAEALDDAEERAETLERERDEADGRVDELEEELDEARQEVEEAREEIQGLEQRLKNKKEKCEELEEKLEAAEPGDDSEGDGEVPVEEIRECTAQLYRMVDAIQRTDLDELPTVDRIRLESAIRETEPAENLEHVLELVGGNPEEIEFDADEAE